MNLWKEKASWVLCKGEQKKDSRVSFGQRKNRKYPCALIAAAIIGKVNKFYSFRFRFYLPAHGRSCRGGARVQGGWLGARVL